MECALLSITEVSGHTFISNFLRNNPTVVDLGSNQGDFARVLLCEYGATVFAAEASLDLYSGLASRQLPKYCVLHAALTGHNGTTQLNLHNDRDASITGSPGSDGTTISVPAITLLTFLDTMRLTTVDLMKVDIEGAELPMFRAAPDEALLRSRQISVEFHEFLYPDMHVEIELTKQRLQRLGFVAVDFSRVNGDVLFLNPSLNLSRWSQACLIAKRWIRGARRITTRALGTPR